jgi:hypothetical protein
MAQTPADPTESRPCAALKPAPTTLRIRRKVTSSDWTGTDLKRRALQRCRVRTRDGARDVAGDCAQPTRVVTLTVLMVAAAELCIAAP